MKCSMIGVAVATVLWVSLIIATEILFWGWNGEPPDAFTGFAALGGVVAGAAGFLIGDSYEQ